MKKSEVTKKVREIDASIDLEQYEKIRRIEMQMAIESREGL